MFLAKVRKVGTKVTVASAISIVLASSLAPSALAEEVTQIAIEDAPIFQLTYTASGLNLLSHNEEGTAEPETVAFTFPDTALSDKTANFTGINKATYFHPLFSDDFIAKAGDNADTRFANTGLRIKRIGGPGKIYFGKGQTDQAFATVLNTNQAEVTKDAILPVNTYGDDLAHIAFDTPGKYKLLVEAVETNNPASLQTTPLPETEIRAVSTPKVFTFLVGSAAVADTSDPFATPEAEENPDNSGDKTPPAPPGDPLNPQDPKKADPEQTPPAESPKEADSPKETEKPSGETEKTPEKTPEQAKPESNLKGSEKTQKSASQTKLNQPNQAITGSGTPGASGITGTVSGAVKNILGTPTCFASFEGGEGNLTIVPKVKDDRQSPSKWYNFNEISFTIGEAGVANLPQAVGTIPAGSKVWMIGSTQQKNVPWVGANTMSDTVMNETTGEVTWTLSSFSGPGAMEVFTSGNFGTLIGQKWFSANGNTGSGSVTIPKNTHVHPNWVFSAPGIYRVGITQTATLKDGTQVSGTDILFFQVGAGNGARDGHFDIGSEVTKAGAKRVWKDAQGNPCTPTEADLKAAGLANLAATGTNFLTLPLLVLGLGLGVFGFALRMRPRNLD
ncbi:TIGR03773 family transporter-associated surface protein [Gleimia sp. 6138-11-ORH1]|uniref:TIGR03773 family transporter-associated surface protein n=1 Tax=Gleimia sp. 6138-11-ORH1 TaxID=2973937 RepID=UPI0021682CA4|nr:TIGR03773 family transporter-associated surface protein [Gleimia sp. 6138-11-ORH1]MCS4484211.1 TIGR03773 family transporter-associated surface protein [Gleimia sp. 6138-11-ORH1]